jgi:23S rRNA pseudouridine1911/1915/1917 synthase
MTDDLRTVTVPSEHDGARLDVVLAAALDDVSRARLKRLIEKGRVTVDDQPVTHASRRVAAGARVVVSVEPPEPTHVAAEDIPLDVLYEDEHIVVVNKPAGLVVHPGAGNRSGTLVNALLAHAALDFPDEASERAGLVHRLDKDTSGVLLVTKHPAALERYQRLFADRKTDKTYLALVKGHPKAEQGRIETLYGRHPYNRLKFTGKVPRGKTAVTLWKALGRSRLATALEVRILTGRTHQIRVHLAELGFPVVADLLYGQPLARPSDPGSQAEYRQLFALTRQALHAWRLAFPDPYTGQRRTFEAPLPPDLAAAFALAGVRA